MPVPTSDKLRYEYDSTSNDGEDPSELRRIVHELTEGSDYLVWARTIQHDALGRQLRAHFADRNDGGNPSIDLSYNTDGTIGPAPISWTGRMRQDGTQEDVQGTGEAAAEVVHDRVQGGGGPAGPRERPQSECRGG